ncbi:MAG: TolC family protein [Candidatus Binataceae bacterium]
MRSHRFVAAVVATVLLTAPASAKGQDVCVEPLGQAQVVGCALQHSPEVQRARSELAALRGRRVTAGTWLPENPLVSFSADQRQLLGSGPDRPQTFNWYFTLSQGFEIAGQRGARLRKVDAETEAQVRRLAVTELEVAAQALRAYFEVVAARQVLRLAERVGRIADALRRLAEEQAAEGLLSPLRADLIAAESIRIGQIRFAALHAEQVSTTLLKALLGIERPGVLIVRDEMTPPFPFPPEFGGGVEVLTARALMLRGEVAAADAERRALLSQLDLVKRARVPNPTFSFFAQRDGFNERVLGGGLSIAIPLPAPIGPSRSGEITETLARIEQSRTDLALIRRRVQIEVAQAYADWSTRADALMPYTPRLMAQAARDLSRVSEGLAARQFSVTEALIAQRILVDLEIAEIEARRDYALAWVNLMRVAGFDLAGGKP